MSLLGGSVCSPYPPPPGWSVARTLGAYRRAEDEIREALIAYANANLDPTSASL